jgi:DNA-directed RNA polymerase specialized sigma24 family protein
VSFDLRAAGTVMASFRSWTDPQIERASDEELVAYVRDAHAHGRPDVGLRACGRLLYRYEGMIQAKARAKVPWTDATEVAQDVHLQAVRAIYGEKQIGVFKAYLSGIANNVIADYHRNREGLLSLDPLPSDHERDEETSGHERGEIEAGYESVESRLQADSARNTLESVLARRSDSHRFVIEELMLAKADVSARDVAEAAQARGYSVSEANIYKIKERFLTDYETALRAAGFGPEVPTRDRSEARG